MAQIVELDGVRPTIGAGVYLAPTAVLIGNVHIGDRVTVWFGTVLRGDFSRIEVGPRSSIQDNAVLHCASDLPTIVGAGVTIGHGALLEGCEVHDGAVVGMGAIVLHYASVGAGAVIAAGGVVAERQQIAPGTLAAGVPAREKKVLSGSAQRWTEVAVEDYQQLRRRYLSSALMHSDDGVSPEPPGV